MCGMGWGESGGGWLVDRGFYSVMRGFCSLTQGTRSKPTCTEKPNFVSIEIDQVLTQIV